jgi:hypothetical protein
VTAVDDHIALFGKAPEGYGYDRAGYSEENVTLLRAKGVNHVGLAPRGRAQRAVRGQMKQKLVRERAQVEAGSGTVKHSEYGFTRPAARSAPAMAMCGQRAILGYNLNKFVRGLTERNKMVLVG